MFFSVQTLRVYTTKRGRTTNYVVKTDELAGFVEIIVVLKIGRLGNTRGIMETTIVTVC